MNQEINDVLIAHSMAQVFANLDRNQALIAYKDLVTCVESGESLCSYVPCETYENFDLPKLLNIVDSLASNMGTAVVEVMALKQPVEEGKVGPIYLQQMLDVSMPGVIGDYDSAYDVQEWKWVSENASLAHIGNDHPDNPTYEFLINMANYDPLDEGAIPEKLWSVFKEACRVGAGYVLFFNE